MSYLERLFPNRAAARDWSRLAEIDPMAKQVLDLGTFSANAAPLQARPVRVRTRFGNGPARNVVLYVARDLPGWHLVIGHDWITEFNLIYEPRKEQISVDHKEVIPCPTSRVGAYRVTKEDKERKREGIYPAFASRAQVLHGMGGAQLAVTVPEWSSGGEADDGDLFMSADFKERLGSRVLIPPQAHTQRAIFYANVLLPSKHDVAYIEEGALVGYVDCRPACERFQSPLISSAIRVLGDQALQPHIASVLAEKWSDHAGEHDYRLDHPSPADLEKIDLKDGSIPTDKAGNEKKKAAFLDEMRFFTTTDQGLLVHADRRVSNEDLHRLPVWRHCVPATERANVCHAYHDGLGHLQSGSALPVLQQHFWWRGMTADLQRYDESCDRCQRYNVPRTMRQQGRLQLIYAPDKFEVVQLDIQGPYPVTKHGYRYIISAEDSVTRFTIIRGLRSQSAKEVARFLYYDVVPLIGPPVRILTDNGANISGNLAKEVANFFGSRMEHTTPYHPECNGKKERQNQVTTSMLGKLVNDFQNDWDEYLPLVQYAYNITQCASIKMSPYEALFGRTAHTPLHASLTPPPAPVVEHSDYLRALSERDEELMKVVRDNDLAAKARNKEEYDRRHKEAEIEAGNLIMLKIEDHSRALAGGNKLAPRFEGPFVVDGVKSNGTALKISDPNDPTRSRVNKTVSVKNAKLYNARDAHPALVVAKQKDRLALLPDSPSTDSDSSSTPASPEETQAMPTPALGRVVTPGLHAAPPPTTRRVEALPSSLPPPASAPPPATPASKQPLPGPASPVSPVVRRQLQLLPLHDPEAPSPRVQQCSNPPSLSQVGTPVALVHDSASRTAAPTTLAVPRVPAGPHDMPPARPNPPTPPALAPRAVLPTAPGRVTRSSAQARQSPAPSDSPPSALRHGPPASAPPLPSPTAPSRGTRPLAQASRAPALSDSPPTALRHGPPASAPPLPSPTAPSRGTRPLAQASRAPALSDSPPTALRHGPPASAPPLPSPTAPSRGTRSSAQVSRPPALSDSPPALRHGPPASVPTLPSARLRGALRPSSQSRDKKSNSDDEPLPAPVVKFITSLEPFRSSIRAARDSGLPHSEKTFNLWRKTLREHFSVMLPDSGVIAALNKGLKDVKDLAALSAMLDLWARQPEAGPLARMIQMCRRPVKSVHFVTALVPLELDTVTAPPHASAYATFQDPVVVPLMPNTSTSRGDHASLNSPGLWSGTTPR